jgi:hypothetical protein
VDKQTFDNTVAEIWNLYAAARTLTNNKMLPRAGAEQIQKAIEDKTASLATQLSTTLADEALFIHLIG